nr:PREDICTED: phosphoinositide 3-kinase regulatory subunit 4 [Bemisia tabaci]
MGNQLVGIAPSQIFPVEHYFTDLASLQFDINLGSTRFFKVARAKSQEGLIVVKVFAIHDPSLPLASYRNRIEEVRIKLASAVNCLAFQRTMLTEKAGYLMREYVKYSLYDRISTRPFLVPIEKKWIAFQILYALHQCHKVGVCHGDIKLENILVTSWHWVLLSDFASYKPTFLPDDNPADFSYFFDTSRRRTCYIAPERFLRSMGGAETGGQLLFTEENVSSSDLTPAMDIFSTGCALAELFSDGAQPTFDLSQLLSYRAGDLSLDPIINKLEDPAAKELVRAMLHMDPSQRCSAEHYLDQERGRLFPEYFYSFLQSYMLIFSSTSPILSPDEKIERLKKDVKNIVNLLKVAEGENVNSSPADMKGTGPDSLVLITSLVTSCIRGLHLSTSKLQALDVLLELSHHVAAETILDRIIPYVFHLVNDPCPRVRVSAILTLNKSLALVESPPLSDVNIFPEYVLPGLSSVARDEAVIVRTAYAETIAQFAETALRYLERCHTNLLPNETTRHNYESEYATLHEMIQLAVATLLTDSQNIVKQTLIENGITKLCAFFGKQKANDIILSHMITFLNDKGDRQLRGSFFDCIVGVASYIGIQSSPILCPLLQQGLTDAEEFVVVKAINAMTALTKLNLLYKTHQYELIGDTACFLVHPNLWIRLAVVSFISALGRSLNMVDVQCKVVSAMNPYLRHSIIQVDREVLVLNALKSPIPRSIYNSILKCSQIDMFLETLHERQKARQLASSGHIPSPSSTNQSRNLSSCKHLFRNLAAEGMTEDVEDMLVSMDKHLDKIHRHTVEQKNQNTGVIDLINVPHPQLRSISLSRLDPKTDSSSISFPRKRVVDDYSSTMNEEWQHMFGIADMSLKPNSTLSSISPSELSSAESQLPPRSLDFDYSLPERSYIQYRCAPCRLELRHLIARRQELHLVSCRNQESGHVNDSWNTVTPPPGYRLRGTLVAHLYEHKASVNRMVTFPNSPLFASCSADGSIRLWDAVKMEGRNIANRSRQVFNSHYGPLVGLSLCHHGHSLATTSLSGSVVVIKVDPHSSKMSILQSRQLDMQEEGSAVDIAQFDSGSQSVLVYATMYGSIIGWDLRAPGVAWKLENDLKQGVITTMCVDSKQCCLTLGTSSGYHTCWDLRFRLPVATVTHPANARVRRMIKHPLHSSWIISAVQSNNEVSMWNLESGFRQAVLWASTAPPLSNSQMNPHSVCTLLAPNFTQSPFLLTGGSDQRVRYWGLDNLSDSYLAIPAASDVPGQTNLSYKCRFIDGTNVVQETPIKPRTSSTSKGTNIEEAPRAGPDYPPAGHQDAITDMVMVQASQCLLVTGSRDGVIKVWK